MSNMKTIKTRLPLVIILGLLVALVVYLNLPTKENEKQRRQRVVAVKMAQATSAPFRDVVEALGNTKANEQVLITSKYADVVDEVSFSDGQIVSKNDILVRLNSQEEAAKVKELEANLAESVSQLNRFQDLLSKKATSKSQVEEQEAKTKAISAQLLSARTKLNELTIKAPFDGVLGFREISVGAYVKAGDIITSLDDLSLVKVDFSVPERFYTTMAIGQTVEADSVAYQGQSFIGKIASIDPRIDPITRTVKVRAEISNPEFKLRPGMLLHIKVERRVDTVLQVPESAIIPIEDKHFVFVAIDGKAQRKTVTVGRRKPGVVEVTSGLVDGESVVVEGALKLRDGTNINVLAANSTEQ